MNDTIKVKYLFSDDYNPCYVNGAYGGISTQGEIVMNFYLERQPIPKYIEHELTEEGRLGNVAEVSPEDFEKSVVRYVSNGVVVNLKTAKDIRDWLNTLIERMEGKSNVGCISNEGTKCDESIL